MRFNGLQEEAKAKINSIRKDEKYSPEYIELLVKEAREQYNTKQEQIKHEIISVIAETKNELLAGKGAINKDQAFDIKLSNTISILKDIGHDMSTAELQELVNPFMGDYQTVQILRRLFRKYGLNDTTEIFGIDNIDHNVKLLEDLEKNINHVFSYDIEQVNPMTLSITISMMED